MKHHSTRGETKRSGRPKTKPVKKKVNEKCGPDCGKMPAVEPHPEAGVYHVCRACGRRVWMPPAGYTTEKKTPGIGNSHRDLEKARQYQKGYKEKKMTAKIEQLVTDVFGG